MVKDVEKQSVWQLCRRVLATGSSAVGLAVMQVRSGNWQFSSRTGSYAVDLAVM